MLSAPSSPVVLVDPPSATGYFYRDLKYYRCDKRLQRLQKILCKRVYYFVNDRPNIQTYALCTFTFSLQTFTIFFQINAFINVYYNFLTFITSMLNTSEL